jgi:hypothetical protein
LTEPGVAGKFVVDVRPICLNFIARFYFCTMKRLIFLLLLLPMNSLASGFNLYTGLDFVQSDVKDEFKENDALFVFGGAFQFNRYVGLAVEAGVQDADITEGTILKGSALLQLNPLLIPKASPFLFAGLTSARLVRQNCEQVFIQVDGGIYGGTECHNDYFGTTGPTVGVGVNIRAFKRSSLILRYSIYHGSENSTLRVFGFAASF